MGGCCTQYEENPDGGAVGVTDKNEPLIALSEFDSVARIGEPYPLQTAQTTKAF